MLLKRTETNSIVISGVEENDGENFYWSGFGNNKKVYQDIEKNKVWSVYKFKRKK